MPIICLHSCPGGPDMEHDTRYFVRLARDGFDVCVYNRVSCRRFSRLDDPRGHTLERDAWVTHLDVLGKFAAPLHGGGCGF